MPISYFIDHLFQLVFDNSRMHLNTHNNKMANMARDGSPDIHREKVRQTHERGWGGVIYYFIRGQEGLNHVHMSKG